MADIKDGDQIMMQADPAEVKMNHTNDGGAGHDSGAPSKKKSRSSRDAAAIKRRCVSTACIACRRRKSKCDGNMPRCAACSSVYGTGELRLLSKWHQELISDMQNVYTILIATIDGKVFTRRKSIA
jgi:hypothetical protein